MLHLKVSRQIAVCGKSRVCTFLTRHNFRRFTSPTRNRSSAADRFRSGWTANSNSMSNSTRNVIGCKILKTVTNSFSNNRNVNFQMEQKLRVGYLKRRAGEKKSNNGWSNLTQNDNFTIGLNFRGYLNDFGGIQSQSQGGEIPDWDQRFGVRLDLVFLAFYFFILQ